MPDFGLLGMTGLPTGSLLAVDPDPNTTKPTRIVEMPERGLIHRGALSIMSDGAVTVAVWVYNSDTSTWIRIANAIAITGTTPTVVDGCAFPNCLTFVQVTANVGAHWVGYQYL